MHACVREMMIGAHVSSAGRIIRSCNNDVSVYILSTAGVWMFLLIYTRNV